MIVEKKISEDLAATYTFHSFLKRRSENSKDCFKQRIEEILIKYKYYPDIIKFIRSEIDKHYSEYLNWFDKIQILL